MDLIEKLVQNITGVLPHLSNEEATSVADLVLSHGVKKERDLRHMTIAILKEKLDKVDSTDLYVEWQKNYGNEVGQKPSSSTSTQQTPVGIRHPLSTIQTNSRPLQEKAREVNSCLPVFEADSPYFPSGVKAAIQNQRRPTAAEREDMVQRIVDRCREHVPNFHRSQLDDVAKALVLKFPKSFKDSILVSEHGSDSLIRQMKVKYDNDRRPKDSKNATEKAAPADPQAFGCTSWNPPCPSNQTDTSQESIMCDLQKTYGLSKKDWDWKTIKMNLEDSYYLQRKHINGSIEDKRKKRRRVNEKGSAQESTCPPNIADHKQNWPFLFTIKGLNLHFKLLTGVDFKDKLQRYVTEQGSLVIDFLSCKNETMRKLNRKMQRADRHGHRSTVFPTLLKMIIANFGEDSKNLLTYVERTTSTLSGAQECVKDFPEERTPFLAIAGCTIYDYDKVFISVDNTFVAKADSILEGFSFVFAAYFAFNIHYSSNLATSLNFFQRVVAEIAPSKGTKCASAVLNRRVNDRLVTFSNKFELYKQKLNEEEAEENEEV